MQVENVDHEATERKLIAQREAAADEVIDGLRNQPLSALKIEAFKVIHHYLVRFFTWRDNERNHANRGTLAKKRTFKEIGNRLAERGVLLNDVPGDEDFYYLPKNELFHLLAGAPRNLRVVRAKVARDAKLRPGELGVGPADVPGGRDPRRPRSRRCGRRTPEGLLRGLGTSRGDATGVARVVATQKDLGRLRAGDILVTDSTDPGWTPALLLISGLVLETGGMLAHGSCISREYGIPAVG